MLLAHSASTCSGHAFAHRESGRSGGDRPQRASNRRHKIRGGYSHHVSARADLNTRLTTLFGAAWTVGSMKYLAESGADVITYYETHGPRRSATGRTRRRTRVRVSAVPRSGGCEPGQSSHSLAIEQPARGRSSGRRKQRRRDACVASQPQRPAGASSRQRSGHRPQHTVCSTKPTCNWPRWILVATGQDAAQSCLLPEVRPSWNSGPMP